MYSDTDRILCTWRATRVEGGRYKGIGIGKGIEREEGRGGKGRAFDTPNEPRLVRMTLRWEGWEGREYLVRLLSSKNRRLDDLSSIL